MALHILRNKWLWIGLVFFALALGPIYLGFYFLSIAISIYYFSVYAMSWDLLFGYAGDVNFGPTVLIGLGAYTAAITNIHTGAPVWVCVLAGAGAAVCGGLGMALPAMRLRGPYFAVITLVAVLLLGDLVLIFTNLTGGEIGLTIPNVISINPTVNYYVAFIFLCAAATCLTLVAKSPIGVILEAGGQDRVSTEALGFSVVKFKYAAFVLSALFSGLAGALMVFYLGTVSPGTVISILVVVQIIIATIVGGRRSILGSIIGSAFIIIVTAMVQFLGELTPVLVSSLALVILLLYPSGFIGWVFGWKAQSNG